MNNLKYKLQRFMIGRYGPDEFYRFLWITYVILFLANSFIRSPRLNIGLWLLLIYTVFRLLSKNIAARQKENAKYLILRDKFFKWCKLVRQIVTDRNNVYRKCPHCKAILRFQRVKGKHNANCPKCGQPMKLNIRF